MKRISIFGMTISVSRNPSRMEVIERRLAVNEAELRAIKREVDINEAATDTVLASHSERLSAPARRADLIQKQTTVEEEGT